VTKEGEKRRWGDREMGGCGENPTRDAATRRWGEKKKEIFGKK